jgi:hypothetical protein
VFDDGEIELDVDGEPAEAGPGPAIGSAVVLRGLKAAAEYNGRAGRLRSWDAPR